MNKAINLTHASKKASKTPSHSLIRVLSSRSLQIPMPVTMLADSDEEKPRASRAEASVKSAMLPHTTPSFLAGWKRGFPLLLLAPRAAPPHVFAP